MAATLEEFKDDLGITNNQHDSELPRFLSAATLKIVELCGPLSEVQVIEDTRNAHEDVYLREWPIRSVQSVTLYPSGRLVAPDDITVSGDDGYVLDLDAAMITYRFSGSHVRVAYTAGRAAVPDDLKTAVLDLASHLWRASQNRTGLGQRSVFGGATRDPDMNSPYPAGFAMPRRVTELIEAHLRPPVIA